MDVGETMLESGAGGAEPPIVALGRRLGPWSAEKGGTVPPTEPGELVIGLWGADEAGLEPPYGVLGAAPEDGDGATPTGR